MKINAAVIGSGIGVKHLEAINKYKKSKVSVLCEKNKTKILLLKKRYPDIKIISSENKIFQDKSINLVSIASYDNFHYSQILQCIKYNKNIIVEKPMCLTLPQLKKIIFLLKKKPKIKITSNLVLRVNSLFSTLKKKMDPKRVHRQTKKKRQKGKIIKTWEKMKKQEKWLKKHLKHGKNDKNASHAGKWQVEKTAGKTFAAQFQRKRGSLILKIDTGKGLLNVQLAKHAVRSPPVPVKHAVCRVAVLLHLGDQAAPPDGMYPPPGDKDAVPPADRDPLE
jgi:hypothetical protein